MISKDIKIFVISLKDAYSRREKAIQSLNETNLSWDFLNAIDGRKLNESPPEYNAKKVTRLLGFELTAGEIGCFLSHKKAWQNCIDSNQVTLILEDDFLLKSHFLETLNIAINKYQDWDIFRLQALSETPSKLLADFGSLKIVKNMQDPLASAGYLIKPSGARKLLENSSQIFEPIDHFLEHTKFHKAKIVAVKPYAVEVNQLPTTITDRPLRPPIKGWKKTKRSFYRLLQRLTNRKSWFN